MIYIERLVFFWFSLSNQVTHATRIRLEAVSSKNRDLLGASPVGTDVTGETSRFSPAHATGAVVSPWAQPWIPDVGARHVKAADDGGW